MGLSFEKCDDNFETEYKKDCDDFVWSKMGEDWLEALIVGFDIAMDTGDIEFISDLEC